MAEVRRGCLVLADISGYTSYLTGVELEHSHDVLADLLGVVADRLAAVGSLAKLEGDAVFVCDLGGEATGEALLAAIDAAYASFVRRRRTIDVRTTCRCDACARIESLDLKFIAHHGEFVEHVVAGSSELLGADVILVHRLLKNSAGEQTGGDAFALITAACTDALGLDPTALGLAPHSERYEDIGEVPCWTRNVASRWREQERRDPRRVAPGEALIEVQRACAGAPSAVWEALLDPVRQLRWRGGATDVESSSPDGARDVGTLTHCVHGSQTFDQEIVDWRPFEYYTYEEHGPFGSFLWTFELGGADPGTRVTARVALAGGRRQRLLMVVGRSRMRGIVERNLDALASQFEH
ncbi:MAG TPA: DUF2652 domain-containing protein [Solirubrobacteraceae bacterium]|nr:DUF2652 domain-containing protein [Solirubrobacteraceae bacterium]